MAGETQKPRGHIQSSWLWVALVKKALGKVASRGATLPVIHFLSTVQTPLAWQCAGAQQGTVAQWGPPWAQ